MHPLFDDYKTIRRRIERKLARPDLVLLHATIFFFATFLFMTRAINPQMEPLLMLLIWSMALAAHSVDMMKRSGMPDKRRETAIERELQERLKSEDTDLVSDARQAFRIQAILDEDLRKRAGVFVSVSALLGLNVALWVMSFWRTGWGYGDGIFAGYWHEVARMVLVAIVPALAFNQWRRHYRDQDIAARVADYSTLDVSDKRKRLSDEDYAFDEDSDLVDDAADRLMLEDEEKAKLKM